MQFRDILRALRFVSFRVFRFPREPICLVAAPSFSIEAYLFLVASNEFFPLFCEIESVEELGRGNLAIDFMKENGMRCVRLQIVARFEISRRLAEIWNFSKSDKSLTYIGNFLRQRFENSSALKRKETSHVFSNSRK